MHELQPVIIPRSDHTISRRDIHPNVLRILYTLRENGHIAYLVGGGVRDLLLGRKPKDLDVATSATPAQLKRLFRNCRLIGRRFRLAHLHFKEGIIEVSTFRSSEEPPAEEEVAEPVAGELPLRLAGIVKSEDGMLLRDNQFGSPEQDARRRDFTVNAIFYNIADYSLIDYVGGVHDLREGVIRSIGDPAQRFVEDPVRMLRALRFSASLGLRIEENTQSVLLAHQELIHRASPDRMFEEIRKLFLLGSAEPVYELLRETGMLYHIFPILQDGCDHETTAAAHERRRRALRWVDGQVRAGTPVSLALMYALLFGPSLERRMARSEGTPESLPVRYKQVMAQFLEDLAGSLRMPHRVSLGTREIMANQWRFTKVHPRNARRFTQMPVFAEARVYFEQVGLGSDPASEFRHWWDHFLAGQPGEPPAGRSDEPKPRRRRRRHRRRRPSEPDLRAFGPVEPGL